MHSLFAFLDFLGPAEILIVGVIAILLYGERLPEVARSFGKQFVEFKKSVQGIRDEFEAATGGLNPTNLIERAVNKPEADDRDREEATAPKFVPPATEPPAASAEDPGSGQTI